MPCRAEPVNARRIQLAGREGKRPVPPPTMLFSLGEGKMPDGRGRTRARAFTSSR